MISLPLPTVSDTRTTADFKHAAGPFGLTARLAIEAPERRDVFALRHTSYISGGYIDPRPEGLFSDRYDDLPNCQSIAVYRDGRAVASVRVCVLDMDASRDGWGDIPAIHVFPEEIRRTMDDIGRGAGRFAGKAAIKRQPRAIEINRLVRHPDFANDFSLVFVLFHLAGYMILYHETDIVFSCVRKNHVPFYKRLKFEPIAGPRSYPELKFATNLLACSQENYETVQQMMPLLDNGASSTGFKNIVAGETIVVGGGS